MKILNNNSIYPPSKNTIGTNLKNPIYNIFNINQKENVNNSLINLSKEEQSKLEQQINLTKDAYNSLIHDSESEINPIIPHQQEDDNKITITFIIRGEIEKKKLTVNKDKKYSEVLNEFYQKYNIIHQKEPISIHHYGVVDKDKTLIENNIRNGDEIILFIPSGKKNSNIEDDDRELFQLFLKEYQAKKFGEYQRELDKARIENKPLPKFE